MRQATVQAPVEPPAPEGAERRGDRRYPLMVPGRFYLADGSEVWCVTHDASLSGYELRCSRKPPLGWKFELVLHHLGSIRAQVVRHTERGFAVRILSSAMPREAFVRQMIFLVRSHAGEVSEARLYDRHVPQHRAVSVRLDDGRWVEGEIIDVSRSGAALDIPAQPAIGTMLMVGRTPATVVRHVQNGIGVRFTTLLPIWRDLAVNPGL